MKSFPRLQVLPPAQRRLWPALAAATNDGFVLYGGTAIALYLGHRESVDFDFFTDKQFQSEDLLGKFEFLQGAEILQSQPNTLTILTRKDDNDAQVKISFFGGLKFGRLEDPVQTPDGVLEVASLQDLLAHKLKVLLQRIEIKDYLDIDALLESKLNLAKGLAGASALFPAFAPQECLKALTYFNDPLLHRLPIQLKERLIRATESIQTIPKTAVKSRTLS